MDPAEWPHAPPVLGVLGDDGRRDPFIDSEGKDADQGDIKSRLLILSVRLSTTFFSG